MLTQFQILREIQSLNDKIQSFMVTQSQEKSRIDRLLKMKEKRQQEVAGLLAENDHNSVEVAQLEKDLFEIESKITLAQRAYDQTMNIEAKKPLAKLEAEKNSLEEKILTGLEKLENNQEAIKQSLAFFEGIEESIEEVREEVFGSGQVVSQDLLKTKKRIELLLEELSPKFRELFLRTQKKGLPISPFSKIKDKSCQFCHHRVEELKLTRILDLGELKACSLCERLLLPPEA